jgi:very-short-patch-repair endonuclease/KaiC/GvpD/RAD55 family RecA-like ATPase
MPMRRAQSADTAPVDPARAQLIDAARTAWIGRLIDVSRRNNLLFYRPIPTSSIDLTSQNPALLELLAGKAVTGETLLPDLNARTGRVLAIARKAQENSEEKGLQTLYLAVGFASWRSSDGGRAPQAPVFLLPLQMKRKGKELAAIEVQLAGEPQVNPVLLHVLADQSGVQISDEELIQVATPKELEGDSTEEARGATVLNAYQKALYAFEARVKGMPEFRTELSAVISNFSFAKLALVNDLKSAGDRLSSNDAVAAIAGDAQSRGRLGSAQVSIDPRELDAKPPDQDFCVVEADSSQQCAIAGIALGQHAVVHGPPGTGKSQTITNLIASLVANGKRVLFVAEKRAALEVVQQRLEKCSLDHLAMDLHGAELRPKRVMEQVARTLSLVRSAKPVEAEATHRQFQERRSRLNAHDALMHTICERAGKTVYDIQGALLRLPKEARTSVRWRGPELAHLTPLQAEKIRDSFREATPFASLFMREDASPWTGVAFRTGQQVQSAIDLAQRLEHESLPHLNSQTREMEKATGLAAPKDFAEADEVLALLKGVQDQLTRYSIGAFCEDLSGLLTELGKAKGSSVRALWLYWTDASVKAAKRRITELRQGNKIGLADALRELTTLQALQTKWRSLSGGLSSPVAYAGLPSLDRALLSAKNETRDLQQIVNNEGWEKRSLEELAEVVERHAHDSVTPYRMLSLSEIEAKLRDFGVQRLVDDLRQRKCLTGLWVATFDHAWLTSALDEMALKSPEIRSFVGSTHGQYVEEFKQLDTDRLRLGRDRVRRIHAEQTIAAMNAHPDQEALIKQEAAKMRCFKPLRKVFEEAADVMMTVCPCWMASPLSVAQLIHPDLKFDYVIFDEASQILPEDAISAIMRGKYGIVAGDSKQLPPTEFFAAASDDDEDIETAAIGYESLLDMMLPFARGFHLNWHYRSRDEALIAFSNHWMYDDRLVTFPGVGGRAAVGHVHVDHVPDVDGQEESSSAEVQRVVDLVLRHAKDQPNMSLGVISMGIKHAMRIQGVLDEAQAKHPELAEFFDPGRPDRFFVKNLERVQGDERDCIILTVGYGKDRAGNLPLRFGPILSAGGMRRLNVAVTRARESMTLVSSFAYTDIDTTKVREGTGLEFLRNYLQYAASNGTVFAHGEISNEPMNDFEADIYEALTARGLKLVPQVGCSSFRIDFGVCHPSEPGHFVLAIEADGATYHSSYTARDRDRLRQQMLENLGWRFHRIWSTDWFQRKHEEIERSVGAFDRAVAAAKECRMRLPEERPLEEPVPDLPMQELSGMRSSIFPPIPKRVSISDYTSGELKQLYNWVMSDGQLRTHDEIADEMFAALPFSRRGSRIEAVLRDTIRRCDQTVPRS